MTDEEVSLTVADVPDPIVEMRAMIEEQKQIIVKQNAAIKDLTARMNANDKRSAAVPAPQAPAAPAEAPKKDPQDIAYEAMLKEFGIKK